MTRTINIQHSGKSLQLIIKALEYATYQLETDLEPAERPEDFVWTNDLAQQLQSLQTIFNEATGKLP